MTSKVRWSLPDGVDELLAPRALEVEKLRRKLDHTKVYAIEYVNKHNHFITTTTKGIEPK